MIEEKIARQASDHIKLAEICTRIVRIIFILLEFYLRYNLHMIIMSYKK
jgi:hypothetical protein